MQKADLQFYLALSLYRRNKPETHDKDAAVAAIDRCFVFPLNNEQQQQKTKKEK